MKKVYHFILLIVVSGIFLCGCSVDNASKKLQLDIENGRFGFIDEEGKVAIDFKYMYAEPFKEGLAVVKNETGYGFINKRGEECIPLEFEYAGSFCDGIALVIKDDKFKYINTDGDFAFETDYYDAYSFSEDMAVVANTRGEGEMGYIDKNGDLVIPCIYDYARPFSDGLACVKKDGICQYIDKTGNVVLDIGELNGESFNEGYAPIQKNEVNPKV